MKRARLIWLRIHKYIGVALALPLLLVFMTGTFLVFYPEIDRAFNPQVQPTRSFDRSQIDLHSILQRVQQEHPSRTGPWRIELPLNPSTPIQVRYYNPAETAGKFFSPLMITLDSSTLQITSSRFWGDYLVTWVYDLHYTFLAGSIGRTIVGWLGVFGLFSILSGVVLWWPKAGKFLKALKPQLRHGAIRKTYDIHVLSGIYCSVVLIVLTVTGIVLAWPDASDVLLQRSVKTKPGPLYAVSNNPVSNLNQVVQLAQSRFKGSTVRWVESSYPVTGLVTVRLAQPFEVAQRFPNTYVWIDSTKAEILKVQDASRLAAGDVAHSWMHPLHNGEAFGALGRWLVAIVGLVSCALPVTGLMRWLQKRRAKSKTLNATTPP